MKNLVNQAVKDNCVALCRQFASAGPFRHIAIDSFLDEDFARSLLESFPASDETLAINENGEVGGKVVHENIASLAPVWQELDKLVACKEFREMVSALTGIGELQFDPHYFGGGTQENLHGQSLDPHVDFSFHPKTRLHRRLNLILYLSPEWDREWGGSIQLYRDPYQKSDDEIVTITPAFNRCVIFETSECSWHGFKRIDLPENKRHLSRKSLVLYYYTDSRPVDEPGMEHSAMYVEEHLPEHFEEGMTLSAVDLQHISNLLARRDRYLKRVCADVEHLNTELNILRVALGIDEPLGNIEPDENDSVELVIMKKQVENLQRRIREFETSISWRITGPLRSLKRVLSRRADTS
jgi:hypothetical protein